jgi:hypothetical protein
MSVSEIRARKPVVMVVMGDVNTSRQSHASSCEKKFAHSADSARPAGKEILEDQWK